MDEWLKALGKGIGYLLLAVAFLVYSVVWVATCTRVMIQTYLSVFEAYYNKKGAKQHESERKG